jgi:hypothetical protein
MPGRVQIDIRQRFGAAQIFGAEEGIAEEMRQAGES